MQPCSTLAPCRCCTPPLRRGLPVPETRWLALLLRSLPRESPHRQGRPHACSCPGTSSHPVKHSAATRVTDLRTPDDETISALNRLTRPQQAFVWNFQHECHIHISVHTFCALTTRDRCAVNGRLVLTAAPLQVGHTYRLEHDQCRALAQQTTPISASVRLRFSPSCGLEAGRRVAHHHATYAYRVTERRDTKITANRPETTLNLPTPVIVCTALSCLKYRDCRLIGRI